MKKKICFILRGAQGSGKSTFANNYRDKFTICSADHFFEKDRYYNFVSSLLKDAHEECSQEFSQTIAAGSNVIVDNTNAEIWEYRRYVDAAIDAGYFVYIITFNGEFENVHKVPSENVEKKRSQVANAKLLPDTEKVKNLFYSFTQDYLILLSVLEQVEVSE